VNPGGRQWAVNLIGYNAISSFGSPSYYAQQMFGQYLGDRTVPLQLEGVGMQRNRDRSIPGVFASATRDSKRGTVYLKLVNALDTPQTLALDLQGAKVSGGTSVELAGMPSLVNTLASPRRVVPVTSAIAERGTTFTRTLAPHSVNVLILNTRP
jgi:alpha-L-arabinofuranosidase